MGATRTKLTAAGFNPEQPFQSRPNLSVAEKGKKYSVKFEPPADCGVYAIDGDVIKQGCRCDKLVVTEPRLGKDGGIEIFVELKGKNVSHAIEQLETTLQHPLFAINLPESAGQPVSSPSIIRTIRAILSWNAPSAVS